MYVHFVVEWTSVCLVKPEKNSRLAGFSFFIVYNALQKQKSKVQAMNEFSVMSEEDGVISRKRARWKSDERKRMVKKEMRTLGIYWQGNDEACWNSSHLRKWTTAELSSDPSFITYMPLPITIIMSHKIIKKWTKLDWHTPLKSKSSLHWYYLVVTQ